MSQENAVLHYRVMDAYNRRDLDAYLELMDDGVEGIPRIAAIEGGYSIEILEVRDFGDVTVAAVRARGHGAGSGTPLDEAPWQVARWRRGKCALLRMFDSLAEALETAGPAAQDTHADS